MCEIVINELLDELRAENDRLLRELRFSSKCNAFLHKYRKCLLDFNNHCVCHQKTDNYVVLEALESQYKTIVTQTDQSLDDQRLGGESEVVVNEWLDVKTEEEGCDEPIDETNDIKSEINDISSEDQMIDPLTQSP